MTQQEIIILFNHDAMHKFIFEHLDDNTLGIVAEILSVLDKSEFKEFNKDAKFDLTSLPIPFASLESNKNKDVRLTEQMATEMEEYLAIINKTETNKEYPCLMIGDTQTEEYYKIVKMPIGESESCEYEWDKIEEYIKTHKNKQIALFHTHPNPLGVEQNTLYNKHQKELSELGIQPNGLNLSLSDIYAQMYLEELIKKHKSDLTSESVVLMHDGILVSFSTLDGIKLNTNEMLQTLTESKKTQDIL